MEDCCELKAENSVVNRYVKALYEVSVSLKMEKQILDELKLIKESVSSIDGCEKYLKKISLMVERGKDFVIHLKNVLRLSQQLENFLLLLVKNERLSLLLKICDGYLSFIDKVKGKKFFLITYAGDFSENDRQRLMDNLHSIFGGEIEYVIREDSSLIGGIKVQFRSKILDYSVKSRLARLHRAIKGDVYEN
ncbi:MAG: ATP synthase F1 subunit delta [Holosporaceae bacterium]|jgi:F-type H+-transporting ATPase subunit delta|nr:ATP synthase F1 subunit delta [Holosporaceae bacterium]